MKNNDKTILESTETVRCGGATLLDAALSDAAMRGNEAHAENAAIARGNLMLDTYTVESDAIEGGKAAAAPSCVQNLNQMYV